MDRYTISSMFGQGTFGRLYRATLREDLTQQQLPQWVTAQVEAKKERRKRYQQEQYQILRGEYEGHTHHQQAQTSDAATPATAAAVTSSSASAVDPLLSLAPCIHSDSSPAHEHCTSTFPDASSSSSSSSSNTATAADIDAIRKEMLVIKEVPFQGLPQQEQQDILNEVRVMSAVNHHSFIAYYESFLDNGCLYIVMEYAEKGDLAQLLNKRKPNPLTESELWRYLLQLLTGLSYLHTSVRILHRDIKPANIFLDKDMNIKIGDLGLGRILGSKSVVARTNLGTPLYFSPELCLDQPYDEKSDVWSLGCLLYELATFNTPFIASNQIALAKKIVHESPLPLPTTLSSELRFLIMKMLEKDVSKRPSINQMLLYSPVKLRRGCAMLMEGLEEGWRRARHQSAWMEEMRVQHEKEIQRIVKEEEEKRFTILTQLHTLQSQYSQLQNLVKESEDTHTSLLTRISHLESSLQTQESSSTSLLQQYQMNLQREESEKLLSEQKGRLQEQLIVKQEKQIERLVKEVEVMKVNAGNAALVQQQMMMMQAQQQQQQQQHQDQQRELNQQQQQPRERLAIPPSRTSDRDSSSADIFSSPRRSTPTIMSIATPNFSLLQPSITTNTNTPLMTPTPTSMPMQTARAMSPVVMMNAVAAVPIQNPTPSHATARETARDATTTPTPSQQQQQQQQQSTISVYTSPHTSPAIQRTMRVTRTPYLGPALRVPAITKSNLQPAGANTNTNTNTNVSPNKNNNNGVTKPTVSAVVHTVTPKKRTALMNANTNTKNMMNTNNNNANAATMNKDTAAVNHPPKPHNNHHQQHQYQQQQLRSPLPKIDWTASVNSTPHSTNFFDDHFSLLPPPMSTTLLSSNSYDAELSQIHYQQQQQQQQQQQHMIGMDENAYERGGGGSDTTTSTSDEYLDSSASPLMHQSSLYFHPNIDSPHATPHAARTPALAVAAATAAAAAAAASNTPRLQMDDKWSSRLAAAAADCAEPSHTLTMNTSSYGDFLDLLPPPSNDLTNAHTKTKSNAWPLTSQQLDWLLSEAEQYDLRSPH